MEFDVDPPDELLPFGAEPEVIPGLLGVDEHTLHISVSYELWFPTHDDRKVDPNYHFFNEARRRMEKMGLLKCWICGIEQQIQVHHSVIEFALLQATDWQKVAKDYPGWNLTSDDDLAREVNSEGGLTALCQEHHTGSTGIHTISHPAWIAQKYLKDGSPSPMRSIPKEKRLPIKKSEQ